MQQAGKGKGLSRIYQVFAGVVAVWLGVIAYQYYDDWSMQRDLLTAYPDDVPANPVLTRFATQLGETAVTQNCTSCHGAELQGDQSKGAPSLTDPIWLYEQGDVSDIERTILYGIRSGHPRTRNITDMPAMGAMKQLTPEQERDVVEYTLSLTTKQGDPNMLARGRTLFEGDAVCYDCHAPDGLGNPDYGAPNLTDNEWLYGGDREAIRRSVHDGRHGLCPAFFNKLDLATIRGLAVYIHQMSHPTTQAAAGTPANGAAQNP